MPCVFGEYDSFPDHSRHKAAYIGTGATLYTKRGASSYQDNRIALFLARQQNKKGEIGPGTPCLNKLRSQPSRYEVNNSERQNVLHDHIVDSIRWASPDTYTNRLAAPTG